MKLTLNRKLLIDKNLIRQILFILFFCDELSIILCSWLFGSQSSTLVFTILMYGLIILYCLWNNFRDIGSAVIVYAIIVVLVSITWIIHPEYSPWFTSDIYGIKEQFLTGRSGILGLLIISIITDRKEQKKLLEIVAWIAFIYFTYQYIQAMSRGYWNNYSTGWSQIQGIYNLTFGYNMLFPAAYFGSSALLRNKKIHLIPYVAALIMITTGGSRGAALFGILLIFAIIPYKWSALSKRKRIIAIIATIITILVLLVLYVNSNLLIAAIVSLCERLGISSRTITLLAAGSFSEANGRDRIYEMALELIRTGGLFGHGVYGDRIYIGQYYRWGYSHNIILELFVSFGYLGGMIFTVLLIIGIVWMYRMLKDKDDQVVFMTLFVSSLKLLVSDSFWYSQPFWALIGLMLLYRKQERKSATINTEIGIRTRAISKCNGIGRRN